MKVCAFADLYRLRLSKRYAMGRTDGSFWLQHHLDVDLFFLSSCFAFFLFLDQAVAIEKG
tara:strand:+ start:152 stop:331 length:180 start_codon:yes stop_codon:yes gene_type:complete